jgi:amidase
MSLQKTLLWPTSRGKYDRPRAASAASNRCVEPVRRRRRYAVGNIATRFRLIHFGQTNCLTEICFDDAIAQARELDAFWKAEGRLKGPLHGVPMSLKDQFNVKGYDSTLGYVGRAFRPAASDALLVDVLKELGAIIIAKTNLPQSIMVRIPRFQGSKDV